MKEKAFHDEEVHYGLISGGIVVVFTIRDL